MNDSIYLSDYLTTEPLWWNSPQQQLTPFRQDSTVSTGHIPVLAACRDNTSHECFLSINQSWLVLWLKKTAPIVWTLDRVHLGKSYCSLQLIIILTFQNGGFNMNPVVLLTRRTFSGWDPRNNRKKFVCSRNWIFYV